MLAKPDERQILSSGRYFGVYDVGAVVFSDLFDEDFDTDDVGIGVRPLRGEWLGRSAGWQVRTAGRLRGSSRYPPRCRTGG